MVNLDFYITSSYNEESTAMDIALDWNSEHCSPDTRVAIVTDSQSMCEALQGFGQDIKELRSKLTSIVADVTIQWVLGVSRFGILPVPVRFRFWVGFSGSKPG